MITKGLVGVLHNSWTLALLMLLPLLCRLLESDGASRVSSCMCEKLCRWHLSGTGAWWLLVLYWLTSNEFNLYFFLFVILENTSLSRHTSGEVLRSQLVEQMRWEEALSVVCAADSADPASYFLFFQYHLLLMTAFCILSLHNWQRGQSKVKWIAWMVQTVMQILKNNSFWMMFWHVFWRLQLY